jgi:hypothetical protein
LFFGLIRSLQNIFQSGGSACSSDGYHSLVIASIRYAIQLAAIFKAHGDATLACQLQDLFHAGILPPFGNEDAVKRAACLKRLANCMDAGKSIHGKRVYNLPLKVKS